MNVYEKLIKVQSELKAPKSCFNNFGGYAYRTCEDIMNALKPLLVEVKATVKISDDLVMIGDRYYIKSTATFIDVESGESVENTAFAREPLNKKGMDEAQISGASSSYCRKYALNGLFLIDDTKDADSMDNSSNDNSNQQTSPRRSTPQTSAPSTGSALRRRR